MRADHLVFLVVETSAEEFLRQLLDRYLPGEVTYEIHPFEGKDDLLKRLESRLRAYSRWLPQTSRLFVLVDRDDDDCLVLKARLETIAANAGLTSRNASPADWQVATRLPIEELEAWYFGDWEAVSACYAGVKLTTPSRARYRNPDAVRGGTWQAFERVLQTAGYYRGGLRKIEAAKLIGAVIDPTRCRSASFQIFWSAVQEAVA